MGTAETNLTHEPIYMDYHAHAPLDPRVLDALGEAFRRHDANPHSGHVHGEAARAALESARADVAGLVGAVPAEVVFTSGATEANNLVFEGLADRLAADGRRVALVGATEHASVLAAAGRLATRGFTVRRVPVDHDGIVSPRTVAGMAGPDTGIVSVAAANHEVGTIQPLAAIASAARAAGALMHSDLSQAAGKVEVRRDDFDVASLSSHKLCGPVGIGALVASRKVRSRLRAQVVGGGQEGGHRSGSVPVPLCVAFGVACRIAAGEWRAEAARVGKLRDRLLTALLELGSVDANGRLQGRLPGNINLSAADVDGEALVMAVRGTISISTGSACDSRSIEPSHVLTALGLDRNRAEGAVRIGLGRFTTEAEVEVAARAIAGAVRGLRATRERIVA